MLTPVIRMFFIISLFALGCSQGEAPAPSNDKTETTKTEKKESPKPSIKTGKGVDAAKKLIKIGTLNDESGPAAIIGKPYAAGKRILEKEINSGKSDILPAGWSVELVEKDHGYNPGKAQQAYDAIKNDVLFIGTSFGTPVTVPLRPFLEKDGIVAYPASLSSLMAGNRYTPPAGPSYIVEAMRALDFVISQAGGADKVKAGIIYQQDDYGKDGLKGWTEAAKTQGVTMVAERPIKPGQKDFTAEITELKNTGATHIYLAVLPSGTGPILGTAAAMKYMPVWLGATPSWIDAFFAHPKLPAAVFSNFYWVSGMPYWGEKITGMDKFMASFKAYGEGARPDFYTLMSYLQGRIAMEIAKRAIEAGDISRAGYMKALQGIEKYDGGGMLQPVGYAKFPYVVGTKTRILKPDFTNKTWGVSAGYADPSAPKTKAAGVEPTPAKAEPTKVAPAKTAPAGK